MRDIDGREAPLKEAVIFSSKVNQPILCYGRLVEQDWESMVESRHWRMNLQNRPLTAQGRVRVTRDEDESCLEVHVLEAVERQQVGDSMSMAY